ncbi:MAG: pentapeptide repeat-containing protein [Pseudonocardia sp.]
MDDDAEHADLDLSELVAEGAVWRRRRLVRCRLRGADLRELVTEQCVFDECDLTGADLGDSRHRGTAFRTCMLRGVTLSGSAFHGCSLLGTVLVDARL